MKVITQERLKELLNYDPETGIFTWRVSRLNRAKIGDVAGYKTEEGYLRMKLDGVNYLAHRLAWLYMTGVWPSFQIDHINHVPDDNSWKNLRDVTVSVNQQNQIRAQKRSKTGLLGVSPSRGWFVADIRIKGKHHLIGRYATAELAHEAYLEAKRKYHVGNTL